MSDEEETDYSQTEGEEEDDEGGVHRDRWNDVDDEEDSDEDDEDDVDDGEDDVDDGEDEDLPHLDGYLEGQGYLFVIFLSFSGQLKTRS